LPWFETTKTGFLTGSAMVWEWETASRWHSFAVWKRAVPMEASRQAVAEDRANDNQDWATSVAGTGRTTGQAVFKMNHQNGQVGCDRSTHDVAINLVEKCPPTVFPKQHFLDLAENILHDHPSLRASPLPRAGHSPGGASVLTRPWNWESTSRQIAITM
jgi:hypothetical protein